MGAKTTITDAHRADDGSVGGPGVSAGRRHPGRIPRRLRVAVVSAPVVVMLLVGSWGLDRGSTWFDEEMTRDVSRRTVPQIWALVQHTDIVHAAYYLFMHVWTLAGSGEVWLRVPSVLAAAGSAGLLAVIGMRLAGLRAGLLAGLVFCVLPFVSFYAQTARSYSLVMAAVLTGTYCLIKALESGSGTPARWWVAYGAAMVLAQTLNELAVLALAAHATTLLASRVRAAMWWRWAVCLAVCGIALVPLALASRAQSVQVDWLRAPTWVTAADLARTLFGTAPLAVVVLAVLAVVGVTVPRRAEVSVTAVAVPLLVVPSAVLMLVSQVQPLYVDRYVFYSVAAVPLLAGAGLDRAASLLTSRGVSWAVCGVVLLVVALAEVGSLSYVRTLAGHQEDLAGAAQIVADHALPGDGVLFLRVNCRAAALGYPDAFRGTTDLTLAESPEQSATLLGTAKTAAATRTALLGVRRVWVCGRPGLYVGSAFVGARADRQLLRRYFHLVDRYDVHHVEVALFERRTDRGR